MKIAILSDIHEHKDNLLMALDTINKDPEIEALLFCGDFCAPPIAMALTTGFTKPIHIVFGNNDGDRFMIANVTRDKSHVTIHGEHAAIELGGRKIAMTHYPFYGTALGKSGDFDLVCFGHDHDARIIEYGKCLTINPGSIMGNKTPSSFAIYDTLAHAATLHSVNSGFLV